MAYLDCNICRYRFFPFCKCPDSFVCDLKTLNVCVSSDLDSYNSVPFCYFCKDRFVCFSSPLYVDIGGEFVE